ncbi:hypothetical protein M9H77_03572 [Catharanthus roseus]|uniref:Uncharacterized protein n=1 Tax=Catharanthus roseus TaxID=4058 RepID=A0ACC0CBT5_CATRO|nr:hypothetical protein M9H77_03572 [Catharanthus roseus]
MICMPFVLAREKKEEGEKRKILAPDLHPDYETYKNRQRIALYMASPSYEGLFRWHGRFRLGRVDPLKEGRRPQRVWPNRSTWTCSAVGFGHLVESQEGLETEIGPKADLISSGRSGAQQAAEVLGQEFLDKKICPEGHIAGRHADALLSAVDLVARLRASQ